MGTPKSCIFIDRIFHSPSRKPRFSEPVLLKGVVEHVAGQALRRARKGQWLPAFDAARLWGTHRPQAFALAIPAEWWNVEETSGNLEELFRTFPDLFALDGIVKDFKDL